MVFSVPPKWVSGLVQMDTANTAVHNLPNAWCIHIMVFGVSQRTDEILMSM